MTVVPNKPNVTPDILDRFQAYYCNNPAWGSLHIVLEDLNMGDVAVQFCIDTAVKTGDVEGEALARMLATYTFSQRRKVGEKASRIVLAA